LDIAHRAAPLIARELGISTLLTRDTPMSMFRWRSARRAPTPSVQIFLSRFIATPPSAAAAAAVMDLRARRLEGPTSGAHCGGSKNAASAEGASELGGAP